MKKEFLIVLLLIIAVVISILLFFIIKKKVTKVVLTKDNIKYIHYGYSTGNMMNANVRYYIDYKDGKYIASIKPDGKSEEATMEVELDELGTPYWVAPVYDYKIGLFGGKDIIGAITPSV